jgi:hypothetical protein
MINRDAGKPEEAGLPFFSVTKRPGAGLRRSVLVEQHTAERLRVLESMGLAENTGPGTWRVRREFESILRAMQRSADRQKMLAAHGALISDERLPLAVLDFRRFTSLEGRILVHGEEDTGLQAGRSNFAKSVAELLLGGGVSVQRTLSRSRRAGFARPGDPCQGRLDLGRDRPGLFG